MSDVDGESIQVVIIDSATKNNAANNKILLTRKSTSDADGTTSSSVSHSEDTADDNNADNNASNMVKVHSAAALNFDGTENTKSFDSTLNKNKNSSSLVQLAAENCQEITNNTHGNNFLNSNMKHAQDEYEHNDDTNNNNGATSASHHSDQVSDISASASESDASVGMLADEWLESVAGGGGVEGEEHSHNNAINRRSFTICSVITNTSDHGSIRSKRENVDRLLMSPSGGGVGAIGSSMSLGGGGGAGSLSGMEGAAASVGCAEGIGVGDRARGRARSNSRGCMEREVSESFAYTYDTDYYKAADWLRFVPRRSSSKGNSSLGENESSSSADHLTASSENASSGQHRHQHQNHGPSSQHPDHYYRGFDNTRIRTGFHPFHNNGFTTRRRVPTPEDLSFHGGRISTQLKNKISAPIDEEEGGGENPTNLEPMDVSSPLGVPNFIRCSSPDMTDDSVDAHHFYTADGKQHIATTHNSQEMELSGHGHGSTDFESMKSGAPNDQTGVPQSCVIPTSNPPSSDENDEGGIQFESSLRIGGIIRPTTPNHISREHLSPRQQEEQMHIASWDSKFATYACRVDQSQEDRSVEIPLFSMARPHMRSFHFAWFTFFFAFLAWFAITPLLSEVQHSLNLTKEQIWTSSICSVAGAVVMRCISGLLCDIYGARLISAAVLFICGVPTIFTGLVNSSVGLSILRLIVGCGGSAFVTCQYWTSTMFSKEVAGTANALAAGWGNLGGGVAQILVGSILFPLFKLIYSSAGTEMDPAELSWRTCCIIPGLLCAVFPFFILRYSDDSPKGNYRKRKKLGLMNDGSAMRYFKAAVSDHNTWILLIQYGCCFGVELTTSNAAALYFKEEFELSTEAAAAVASTFGWMNLFARGVGGFLSDASNVYRGMQGRLIWQCACFALEGIFVMVFSKAKTLAGAITALITFSLFVQGAEGSTFGIVPYLNPGLTGTVAGIVGAGGNAGAVIFSIMFRQMDYRNAFFYMGVSTLAISTLSGLVWIRGYHGLLLKKRLLRSHGPQDKPVINTPETQSNLNVSHLTEQPSN